MAVAGESQHPWGRRAQPGWTASCDFRAQLRAAGPACSPLGLWWVARDPCLGLSLGVVERAACFPSPSGCNARYRYPLFLGLSQGLGWTAGASLS